MKNIRVYHLLPGFWIWLISIQNNPQGIDLIDACIKYIGGY